MFQSGFVVDEGLCWLYHTYQVLVAWCGVGGGGVRGCICPVFLCVVIVFLVVAWGVAFVLFFRGFFWWWQ